MTTSDPEAARTPPPLPATNSLPDRKPEHLTWQSFAERRIQEAQQSGAFAHLPGFGQPIPDIDQPLHENWWVKKKLREENLSVLPPSLEARRAIEVVRQEILRLDDERAVRRRLEELNETIRQAIYSTTSGPSDGVQLLDVETEVCAWRTARPGHVSDSNRE
jgi:hypothetical protein